MKSNKGCLTSSSSDHMELVRAIYLDACAKCTADVSDLRDLMTIESRVEQEGESFLTITLPTYARDLERALAEGHISPTSFRSFKKLGSIPVFLRGMIGLLFDYETGRIYDETNLIATSDFPTIIDSIRQICLAFKKVEIPCTPERERRALANFINVENSFEEFNISDEDESCFKLLSSVLWDNLLGGINPLSLVPKHGPGATAEKISGNQKYNWRLWHERLEPYFPFLGSALSLGAYESRELENVSFVSADHEQPVRVVCVPKDLKGPRIIAIEPCCMQYTQQGIRDVLYGVIESYWLTRGHINFADQSVNQSLALIGSKRGRLATIDLSDASDRVPRDLALSMFDGNPDLRDAVDACRSTSASMPDGTIVSPLRKFASMGSALCFPVEAMYFYTICVMARLVKHGLPVTQRNCFKVSRRIFVYGDDIVVPAADAVFVLDYLRKYNCKVNTNKTFWTGKFRESCGVDAYGGVQVTPVYVRQQRPENLQQGDRLVSWMATANLFYKKGYWQTAELMYSVCERHLGLLPWVSETSPALGRISFHGFRSFQRWNSETQVFEVKAYVAKPVYRTDVLEGYAALSKSLAKLFELDISDSSRDRKHLEQSALHGAVTLKRRWVPAQ